MISVAWNIRSPGGDWRLVQCQASSAMRGGLLVQRRHGPMPRCEVSGIDNSEGGHPHAHVWARGLWVLGREPWMSIHLSRPMLCKSPRSTADTCPSEATAPSLIVSRASSHLDWAHRRCVIASGTHPFCPKRQKPNWRLLLWIHPLW